MKRLKLSIFLLLLGLLVIVEKTPPALALVVIDSVLLGENPEGINSPESDPLQYVFLGSEELEGTAGKEEDRQHLMSYYGLFLEGSKLRSSCRDMAPLEYASFEEKNRAKRSLMATFQYIGLDLSVRALAQYARFFEWQDQEYKNMVKGLIGNYCSLNTTVVSLRQLAKNMLEKFRQGDKAWSLPEFTSNNSFPPLLSKVNLPEAKKRELLQTIKLFRAFCSWGEEAEDPRMMVPLLNNPYLYSYIIRQLTRQRTEFHPEKGKAMLVDEPKTVQVTCNGLICRRDSPEQFNQQFPLSLGSISLRNDLVRLYCSEYYQGEYRTKEQIPQVRQWINQESFDDDQLLVNQMISLLTGVPDLFVRAKSFAEIVPQLRMPLERTWENWALMAYSQFSQDIYYEESVTVEKMDLRDPKDTYNPQLRVDFSINLGEFDRLTRSNDKVKAVFYLELPFPFLRWLRDKWEHRDPRETAKIQQLQRVLQTHLEEQLKRMKRKFVIIPWEGDIEKIIVNELLDLLESYKGPYFEQLDRKEPVRIPVTYHYGVFALKYLHFRYRAAHGLTELDL